LLRAQDSAKAIEPLEQLAASGNRQFQVFGIAGLVVAYANEFLDEQAYYEHQRLSVEDKTMLQEQEPRMAQLLNNALDMLANPTQ
jgi:hypothetical protein